MSTQQATTPMSPTMSDDAVLRQAATWRDDGRKVAIATVINTRPVGSQLVVNDKSQFVGSVSGGCIEGAVVEEALKVMNSGQPSLLEFGVSDEMAWEVGLACGGTVEVFVERVEP